MTFDALGQATAGGHAVLHRDGGRGDGEPERTPSATGFASIAGVENVTGGSGNDTLTGDGSANVLDGGSGNDTLRGGLGADALNGGSGDDTIHYTIGDGADTIDGGDATTTRRHAGGAGDGGRRHARRGAVRRRRSPTLEGGTVAGIETVTFDALGQAAAGDTLSYTGTTERGDVNLSGRRARPGSSRSRASRT